MKLFYQIFTKKTILSILIIQCSILSFATTYYISNSGNDSNSGLTTILAWKTLAKVNAFTFKAGDQILFQKGDSFYGTLIVKNSGSSGNSITFGAYGTGANPIITGFRNVTAWTNLGSNIWESTSEVSALSTCNIVVINGVNTPMGRYPNLGYLTYQTFSTNTSITSSSVNLSTTNWTGAEVVIKKQFWIIDRNLITGHSGNTLIYISSSTYNGQNNWGFFIQNDARTLDVQNEWYYNPSKKKIRVYSTSPPTNVQVATQDTLVFMTHKNYITFDNIQFKGANASAIYAISCVNLTIQNCNFDFNYNGINSINWGSSSANCLINNNTINYSNNNAVNLDSEFTNATVTNNIIQNTGMLIGMSGSGDRKAVGLNIQGAGSLVQYNQIINTGYIGISFNGANTTIKNNFIDNACTIKDDGGGIYTYNDSGVNKIIESNIIINIKGNSEGRPQENQYGTKGHGIYIDGSSNVSVLNNSMANIGNSGIFMNARHNTIISGNIVYNSWIAGLTISDIISDNITNLSVDGNVFVEKFLPTLDKYNSTNFTQLGLTLVSNHNDIASWGTFDNNYYARPIDAQGNNSLLINIQPNGATNTSGLFLIKTILGWQTYSGFDANSHKSPQSITTTDDLQFEYNATTTAKTVTLSCPMTDVKGTKYATSVTLQPFTSVVLMKDLTPVVVPDAPTSVVATAGNASASVIFSVPANNGGSAITGYTVTSIPLGGVDSNAGPTSLNHTITGLTNGTSYTFTVKATNSDGTSVASMASNSVTPNALTATTFTFTGPSSGSLNSASTIFTVTPNNLYTGTITITPTGTGSAGLSAKVLTFYNSSAAQTYTITPTVEGSITLTATNNGSLTNPGNLTYSANAIVPDAPTSVVVTAGDASASVTFVAPTNNGGSAITGYTVTSNPTGGTDINAGSTSLNHIITGLTNGTSYSFTVNAINSVGSSSNSVASNSITIATGITNLDDVMKIVVFPNPCHGRFTVRFSEIPISGSRIEVLNLSGRKVTSQIIIGISQEIDLFGQAPGMYFVKSIQGSIEKIDKLVIQH